MQKAKEDMISMEGMNALLRAQLDKMEQCLSKGMEKGEAANLRCKELEIESRRLSDSNKLLQGELLEVNEKLEKETEAKELKQNLLDEHTKMFEMIDDQSKKAEDKFKSLVSQLGASSMTQMTLEKEISELKETKNRFEVQVMADKKMAEDTITELEREIKCLKISMEDKCQDQVSKTSHYNYITVHHQLAV